MAQTTSEIPRIIEPSDDLDETSPLMKKGNEILGKG
jgi:hypothetical protein